jgi:cell wall-associated NlpC family hydrolase
MAVLSALEIYKYARLAGFSPDQAVTMTAVALAESGGDTGAHNPRGEDSRGLWQINVAAHTDLTGTDLYDPFTNAKAAFRVSQQGGDISPWTTTHDGSDARYLDHRAEAEAAARMAGDTARGTWTGTSGYGDPLAAGAGDGGSAAGPADDIALPEAGSGAAVDQFVEAALAQTGDSYVFGAEADPDNADPTTFDCSELVQWAAAQVGVEVTDGSWYQYLAIEEAGTTMSVEEALQTKGALLFWFSEEPSADSGRPGEAHVAISMGDGTTIEARGTQYGVGSWSGEGGRFNYAGFLPGLATATPTLPATPAATVPAATVPAVDTDSDGLVDTTEAGIGTDADDSDTDDDGISDGYELTRTRTDPTKADSDGDGDLDSEELVRGTDPTTADSNLDGRVDTGDTSGDTDDDGLSDLLEKILGTRADSIDSDGDGRTDYLEHSSGLDPLDPLDAATAGDSPAVPAGAVADPLGDLADTDLDGPGDA